MVQSLRIILKGEGYLSFVDNHEGVPKKVHGMNVNVNFFFEENMNLKHPPLYCYTLKKLLLNIKLKGKI